MPRPVDVSKWSSKNLVRTAISAMFARARSAAPGMRASRSSVPSTILVNTSMPTARTSGAANGSSIRPSGSWLAIARPAATLVAGTPTLDARSQVSFSLRAIAVLT